MLNNKEKYKDSSQKPTVGKLKGKSGLHIRSKHHGRYDLEKLIMDCPDLARFVKLNKYNDESIDFSDPDAVMSLNKALLKHFYRIDNWDIPDNYLCPPIPGRADYIHHIADLLASSTSDGIIPRGKKIKCLDIGVGANCIYPIIGNKEYGWNFIGSDIDPLALKFAGKIIKANNFKKGDIELRLQQNPNDIFVGIVGEGERFDLTICNPPFHASRAEAQSGTLRKLRNLDKVKTTKPILNFGGQENELWCDGGEKRFVRDMILQSKEIPTSCFWFSSLVSKQYNLKSIYRVLKRVQAVDVKTIQMGQGNKTSRFVAWTFLSPKQQKKWMDANW